MNKLILLVVSAITLQAQTAVINGATARFRITASTSAPSSSACDASNEVGSLHIRTGNQSSVPTGVSICKQTGSSTYAWGPIGWYSQTTAPATCVVGEIWFDTDASAGSNLNLCTSTNTFTAVSSVGTPAGSDKQIQYNNSGAFGAEAGFEYDPATNTLSVDKISLTGAASESVLTDISTPSAPSSGKTATYTKSGRWCTRANGGAEVCYADGNSSGEATSVVPVALTSGTSVTLSGNSRYFVCTSTCTITVPVPVAGVQYCVLNGNNVSTVITLSAIGSSAMYQKTDRTAYGTAGTGTMVSGGAVGDQVCIVGLDSTHYLTLAYGGTWTVN
jgi:hypothetical protein